MSGISQFVQWLGLCACLGNYDPASCVIWQKKTQQKTGSFVLFPNYTWHIANALRNVWYFKANALLSTHNMPGNLIQHFVCIILIGSPWKAYNPHSKEGVCVCVCLQNETQSNWNIAKGQTAAESAGFKFSVFCLSRSMCLMTILPLNLISKERVVILFQYVVLD